MLERLSGNLGGVSVIKKIPEEERKDEEVSARKIYHWLDEAKGKIEAVSIVCKKVHPDSKKKNKDKNLYLKIQ